MSSPATTPTSRQARGPRPDPVLGVFETLLVLGSRPIELEAHLARLDASARELFGAPPPADVRDLVCDQAAGAELARMRLDVAPDGDGRLAAGVRVAAVDDALLFPPRERGVELAPIVVPGGIGAHKWADRRLLERAEEGLGGPVALIVDGDGTVLEASRGNVFLVCDAVVITPPTDGRILPGVTRARVLGLAEELGIPSRCETVSLERLRAADEIFMTGAVRGIEPVRTCDGSPCGPETAIGSRLAVELRRRWAGEARAEGA